MNPALDAITEDADHKEIGEESDSDEESSIKEEWMFFAGIQHLNSVPHLYMDGKDPTNGWRIKLAQLNLEAAQLSMNRSAHQDAAIYASRGLNVLKDFDCVTGTFAGATKPVMPNVNITEIKLNLCLLGANGNRLAGKIPSMDRFVRVFWSYLMKAETNAVKSELSLASQKYVDYTYKMNFCVAQAYLFQSDRADEAKVILLDLLEQLGCTFPKSLSGKVCKIVKGLISNVLAKKKRTQDEAEGLPFMSDPIKLKTMKLLYLLLESCYIVNDEELVPLILFKSIKYTLEYGICEYSAVGISTTCVVFSGLLNDAEGARIMADYAQFIMKRVNYKPTETGAILMKEIFGYYWSRHVTQIIKPLRDAYLIGQ